MENNVYDLIEDFYTQDEGWGEVLSQREVEGFLRTLTWQGASEDELLRVWDDITVLFIYLGNADLLLGEMQKDSFIDCVGWCARNVAEFSMDKEYVSTFLDNLCALYAYMKKKHIVSSDRAINDAREMLLDGDEVQFYDANGNYLPLCKRLYIVQDLPSKIFLNANERMVSLQEEMREFFSSKMYKHDLTYSEFLFSKIMPRELQLEAPDTPEFELAYWEYFLFDYRMTISGKLPIEFYYEYLQQTGGDKQTMSMLEELVHAKLIFFTVERTPDEGVFNCRNFFTGEQYVLQLPFEDDAPLEKLLFSGHIFYQNAMMLNSVRGILLKNTSRKRFYNDVKEIKDWLAYANYGKLSWEELIAAYPSFLRHMELVYAVIPNVTKMNLELPQVENYAPAEPLADDVTEIIRRKMMGMGLLTEFIFDAATIWADYITLSGRNLDEIVNPEMWAAAVILKWFDIAGISSVNEDQLDYIYGNVQPGTVHRLMEQIEETLDIKYPDPRYISEPALLKELLS